MHELQFCTNLAVALLLGAVIGLERQWRQRMAGLRTNTLVAGGASLFCLLAQSVPADGDLTKIPSYVVSGVGFLGAGVIMKEGGSVRGLNTAATLWCSAAVGCLAGFGQPFQAAIGALAILATNVFLRPIAKKINAAPADAQTEQEFHYQIRVVCRETEESHIRALMLQAVSAGPLVLRAIHSEDLNGPLKVAVTADLESQSKNNAFIEQVVNRLSLEKGISAASWCLGTCEEIAA